MSDTQKSGKRLRESEREAIFGGYVACRSPEERWQYEEDAAGRYGVSRDTIRKVTRDEKRMRKYMKEQDHLIDLAWIRLVDGLESAVNTQLDLLCREGQTDAQMRMSQSAATDVMNRLGISRDRDEPKDAVLTITGIDVGMPPGEEKEGAEDGQAGEEEMNG